MILVLSNRLDSHANHLVPRLVERGAEVLLFDNGDFPRHARATWSVSEDKVQCLLYVEDRKIDLSTVRSIWNRKPLDPVPYQHLVREEDIAAIAGECRDFIDDFWQSLGCIMVPGPAVMLLAAEQKAHQLVEATKLGFELPPTLISTDPDELLDFYTCHGGNLIHKVATYGLTRSPRLMANYGRFTEPLRPRDLVHFMALQNCPVVFQAYVQKLVELRITVVGKRVFAAEIHSQASRRAQHDWRHYDGRTPYLPHNLPAEVASACVALTRRLGLTYGAIDMIVTPDYRYVFLEINPNGEYLWTELETGLPVTEALCDLLIDPESTLDDSASSTIIGAAGKAGS